MVYFIIYHYMAVDDIIGVRSLLLCYNPSMPWKDIEKQRAAIRRHYYTNRQSYIDKALRRKKEVRGWVNKLKEASPCTDCNKAYPYYVMDFDHVGDKNIEINKLINSCSIRRLEEEIKNCELVCSNCHRIRTYERLAQSSIESDIL